MGLTVSSLFKIIHELRPDIIIDVRGNINGNPNDTIDIHEYLDNGSSYTNKEVSYVELRCDERLRYVAANICFDIDGAKCKKEDKMETDKVKEPVKLSSVLELFDGIDVIKTCIKLKTGKYVYIHGEAGTLLELDIIQGCFVDKMTTTDPETDEDIFYILASKQ